MVRSRVLWVGVAVVMGLSAAAAQAVTRYEADWTIKLDHTAQGLEAQTMRILQQRVAAATAYGTQIESQVLLPAGDDSFRLVVRGTTIPRLLEKLLTTPTVAGWARVAEAVPLPKRRGGSPYDEKGPYHLEPWTGGQALDLMVASGTDARSVISAVLVERTVGGGQKGHIQDFLALSLLPGPREFPELVVAGQVVPAADLAGRRHLLLPISADPEERAAVLGVVQIARQPLPCPIIVLSSQIRPIEVKGLPPTVTERLQALAKGPHTKARLEEWMKDLSPLVRRRALQLCRSQKTSPVGAIVHSLDDHEPGVNASAMEALLGMGLKPSLATLRRLLQSPCLDLAREVIRGLIALGTPLSLAEAVRALRDEDLLESCLWVIQETKFRRSLPSLERLIRRPGGSTPVRDSALRVYVQLAADQGRGLCKALLADSDAVLRLAAARRLAALKDEAGTRYLRRMANSGDEQPAVKQAAAASLKETPEVPSPKRR
jgi:hypothetical protein